MEGALGFEAQGDAVVAEMVRLASSPYHSVASEEDEEEEVKEEPRDPSAKMEAGIPYHQKSGHVAAAAGGLSEEFLARVTNMWSLMNVALPISYFVIGFVITFTVSPLDTYMVRTLNASSSSVVVLDTLRRLPWSLKLLFGLQSDCVPIRGQRRKPYFIIGWVLFVVSNLLLASMRQPGEVAVLLLVFLQSFGYILSDVMCDAIVVERSKFESDARIGQMQAVAYTVRYVGAILGSLGGMLLYSHERMGWSLEIWQVLVINAMVVVVCVGPTTYFLVDPREGEDTTTTTGAPRTHRPLLTQLRELFEMTKLCSVYQPMTFIAAFNICMGCANPAWKNFLFKGLNFNNYHSSIIATMGTVFGCFGVVAYRMCFYRFSWRMIYVITTLLILAFSALQLLLIFQVNRVLGIGDLVFAVGDDAMVDFVWSIQFLPAVKMFLRLCPDGVEGTAYALLTSFSNVAYALGKITSSHLASIWDVSNATLAKGEWTGLWKLSLLTSLIQPMGLALVWLLPKDSRHQERLQKSDQRNFWAGVCFCLFLIGALSATIGQSLAEVAKQA